MPNAIPQGDFLRGAVHCLKRAKTIFFVGLQDLARSVSRNQRIALAHDANEVELAHLAYQIGDYFQPDFFSQSFIACGLAFSHWLIERVSLSSILSFMQIQ